ncbi:MAG TPA: LysM peptidoglycan-binding domain-containing protein [Gammaproteobacteria bacterium]|nr:LysM peptidoglycan-binding domain-containing protein [Gammaproteobacteria bacterium]
MKLSWAIKPSGLALSILLLLLLSACNSSSKYDYAAGRNLPNAKYGTIYTVKRGDTLYSIAWVIKQDYRKLAGWNGIRSPYLIRIGQRLRMYPPSSKTAKSKKVKKTYSSGRIAKSSSTRAIKKSTPYKGKTVQGRVKRWFWPTVNRRVTARFNPGAGKDGIDIAGKLGDAIFATADGQVVYAGSGLRGYGRLIILKHNKTYLSAYAHNDSILVAEGQNITAGKKIGRMGSNGKGRATLHFEIRKNGKPVNPASYLSSR